ncbi:MAG: serine O-acetyltransferase [Limnochordales bacterium]|nr:serine O-acetyltransferase [Limnochordales bacterium]
MRWWQTLRRDVQAVLERDPAARNVLEVILCYPGLHALWFYRIAHWFWERRLYLIARMISNFARFLTDVDIHPGAKIGPGLFIDHGIGVVIGETAEIGENVTLYQGCTLGGTGKEKGKRHPTIGNNVVVAAGAKILGSFKVGDNAKIGAGAVVLREVPPNSTVVGVPGRVVVQDGRRVGMIDLDHANLPDPVGRMFRELQARIEQLERQLAELRMLIQPASAPHWRGEWASLASMEGVDTPPPLVASLAPSPAAEREDMQGGVGGNVIQLRSGVRGGRS